ncbi:uncharacterized protein PRCAT00006043001 [Priceomyces carsonii]|uniref:uncharacterized protein n=1 Tax=Priceomyces carsonii TaxID=28549 RepID=UPI002EDA8519|nr:unnamed protein product [Priceomyces carsonii]
MFRLLLRGMNGIFAIEKPSGISSSNFLGELQAIFTKSSVFHQDLIDARNKTIKALSTDKKWLKQKIDKKVKNLKVKIGHGGTLDPLASGVLVVGIGNGTKKLQYYLGECNKTYETKALLGISTTTGDSEGEIITKNKTDHITRDLIESIAYRFVGDLQQTPPIFSALKMNGKALYDYAREGIPLPKPIKLRKVKIHDIKVHEEDTLSRLHQFASLESQLDENGVPKEHQLARNPTLNDSSLFFSDQYLERAEVEGLPKEPVDPFLLEEGELLPEKLPLIHFTTDVSSGTYIRSLVSDIGRGLGSSAYMVELIRVKQSDWELGKNVFKILDFKDRNEKVWGPVLKKVLDNGSDVNVDLEFKLLTGKLSLSSNEKEIIEEQKVEVEVSEDLQRDANESEEPKTKKIRL